MDDFLNQKAVLVLGMHRSGTSAVTAGVEALGISLGDISYESNYDNTKGFFENMEVVRFNEHLFEECGSSWDNPFFCLKAEHQQVIDSFSNKAVKLLTKYYKHESVWALKDPRLCVFLKFWQDAIKKAQCGEVYRVHMLRNPLEVAASLKKRREKNQHYLGGDERQSILMWFFHVFQALNSVDNERNILITFDSLLEDPSQQLSRIASFIQIEPDPELVDKYVSSFLEKKLKHHSISTGLLSKKYPELAFVADFYENLIALGKGQVFTREAIRKVISQVPDLHMLLACSRIAGPVFQDAVGVVSLRQSVADFISITSEKDSQIVEKDAQLANKDAQIDVKDAQLANKDAQIDVKDAQLANKDAQIDVKDAQMADKDAQIADRAARISDFTEMVATLKHSLSDGNTHIGNLNQTILSLENSILVRDIKNKELQQLVAAQERNISMLGHDVESKDKEIELVKKSLCLLNIEHDTLIEKYTQVTSRLSWKIVSKFIAGVVKIPGISYVARYEQHVVQRLRLRKVKKVIEKSGLFDVDYYLTMNPDVKEKGLNPLLHFINHGGFEGRRPNPEFDPAHYLESFPEAVLTGMNPLYHYILYRKESRKTM